MKIIKNPWTFFLFTFLYSWVFWLVSILIGQGFNTIIGTLFYYLGGIGPSLIGIALTYKNEEKEEIKDFWHRSFSFKFINPRWYLWIILLVLIPILIGIGVDLLLGGKGAELEGLKSLISNPISYLIYFVFLISAVLAEEFGWRGYAQGHLQNKYKKTSSGLIIGVFWSLWHLPLFFIEGTYQNGLGIGTLDFWLFFIGIVPGALIYTWIYNRNNKSILSAILFHLIGNLTGELFAPTRFAPLFRFISDLIIAIGLTLYYTKVQKNDSSKKMSSR